MVIVQFVKRSPDPNHLKIKILRFLFEIIISCKIMIDNRAEIEINNVDIIDSNLEEKTLEKKIQKKKLNNGRKITIDAILFF